MLKTVHKKQPTLQENSNKLQEEKKQMHKKVIFGQPNPRVTNRNL